MQVYSKTARRLGDWNFAPRCLRRTNKRPRKNLSDRKSVRSSTNFRANDYNAHVASNPRCLMRLKYDHLRNSNRASINPTIHTRFIPPITFIGRGFVSSYSPVVLLFETKTMSSDIIFKLVFVPDRADCLFLRRW